jgi:Ca-activated chloride channel family protein
MGIDTSLSTRKDLPLEIAAARKFAHSLLTSRDALSVFQFASTVSQALPFTGSLPSIDEALTHLRTGQATALYDAIYLSAQALQRREGRKVLVLVSDGGDTASRIEYPEALRAAQTAETIIDSIIMVPIEADAGRDLGGEHALIQLSEDTGGQYFYASSLDQLDEAFQRIGEQLRTQYLLAYYPQSRPGSGFRRITVELTPQAAQKAARPLTLRHRAGYYTGKID